MNSTIDATELAGRWEIGRAAAQLHRDAVVWDMILPLMASVGNDLDLLDRVAAAGVNFTSLTVAGDDVGLAETILRFAAVRASLARRTNAVRLAFSVDDILAAKAEGKLAVGLHLEGVRCMERNLDMVQLYYDLGVRHSILAFNQNNSAAGGCAEEHDAGLSRFGRRLVVEMNRVGMLIDLSHTGRESTFQIMEASTAPVMISHSNAHRVFPHYRNVTDEQIKMCAEAGGVIGVSGATAYLGSNEATVEALARHIDHIAALVGPQHVGLGTDYVADAGALHAYLLDRPDEWPSGQNPELRPRGFLPPEHIPQLTELLLTRGYSEVDVCGILGGNFIRLCRSVWK